MIDSIPHLDRFQTYEQAVEEFQWSIPDRINIATAIGRGQIDAVTRIALTDVKPAAANTYTFGALDFLSDKFAVVLSQCGITSGDTVGVILPPSAALAVAHLGILKCGAVVVPLPMSSSSERFSHVLKDCHAKAVVIDESLSETLAPILRIQDASFVVRDLRPAGATPDYRDFWTEVDDAPSDFETAETDANSPALIFYVERQGSSIGVVHTHRSVFAQLSAFEMLNNLVLQADSVFWTADDWSSPRAVLGVLYPVWLSGGSLVANGSRDVDTLELMERYEVTNAFLPSAQLKLLFESQPNFRSDPGRELRTILSDAPCSPDLRSWVNSQMNATLHEAYGKPETGWIAGGCTRWFSPRPGSVGRAVPVLSLEVLDDHGKILGSGVTGRIAVHRSDPALFSGFFERRERTAECFIGDWFLTGDIGYKSEDGYLSIHHPHI